MLTDAPAWTSHDMLAASFDGGEPAAPRVVCETAIATAARLDARAAAVAAELRFRGIGTGDVVPVLAAAGPGMVAAWLGVLRVGAAYAPIALRTPAAERDAILRDIASPVVVSDAQGRAAIGRTAPAMHVLTLDGARGEAFEPASIGADEPAVVLYGSAPDASLAGVVWSHRNLLQSALAWSWLLELDASERLLCTSPTSSAAATIDVFACLFSGARLMFAGDARRDEPRDLLALSRGRGGATVATLSPGTLRRMLDADDGSPTSLRAVSCVGGSPEQSAACAECAGRWGVTLRSVYGRTEAGGHTMATIVDPGDRLSRAVGTPLPNARAYVLGDDLEELPPGVAGELHLAGAGVALGYLGRPDLTARTFLDDPYSDEPHARMVCAGELALHRPQDGGIELVAARDVRAPLADAPGPATTAQRPLPVRSRAMRRAAELFEESLAGVGLGRPPGDGGLHPDANFFSLGGHSLLALRMMSTAAQRWGVELPLREFLREPTIAGLGRLMDGAPASVRPAPADPAGRYPATGVQQRLWFLDRVPELRAAYLVPTVLEYRGPVDPARLREAAQLVLARHPALRARFELDRGSRSVAYRTDGPPPVVSALDADAAGLDGDKLRERVAGLCWDPFDLAVDAPARAEVIASAQRTLLVLAAHHIVLDGWALQIVTDEIGEAYRASAEARPARLPDAVHPATVAATAPDDATAGLRDVLDALRDAPLDVELPRDRDRPPVQPTRGATACRRLGTDLTRRVREVAAEHECTTFVALVALLAATLARRTRQDDFVFCFPWAGRESAGSSYAVAMLVNTLLVRADLTSAPTWGELLEQVRVAREAGIRNADVSFDAVVAALTPERDLSRPPITPVIVTVLDAPPAAPDLGAHVRGRVLGLDSLHVKYELALTAIEHPDDLELSIDYAVALFDRETIDALLGDLHRAAADLAARPAARVLKSGDAGDAGGAAPAPAAAAPQQPAATDLHERVSQAWRDVLAVEHAEFEGSFFEAGGNSLLLILLLDELNMLTDRQLAAADLFRHNTVAGQVRLLSGGDDERPAARGATDRRRLLGRARRPLPEEAAS